MSEIVDKWVEKCKELPKIGTMTHMERLEKAFNLEEPDMVPVAPELQLYQVMYSGYTFHDVWHNPEVATDSLLKMWYDLQTDAVWPYICPSHYLDGYLTPEQRETFYDLRDGRSYVVFKEPTDNLDDAIKLMESKPWVKYGPGKGIEDWIQVMDMGLEFQQKMGNTVPMLCGLGSPSNVAELLMGVQHFVKALVTEPKEKIHYYMELVLEERLGAVAGMDYFIDKGMNFCCLYGGARTWGPRQLEEFGKYDRIWAEAAAKKFKYTFWHICGKNLPHAIDMLGDYPIKAIQYDEAFPNVKLSWAKWTEYVARLYKGKICCGNSPTTQAIINSDPETCETMVKEFIEHTTPFTTAWVIPGCQPASRSPLENIKAMIDGARKYGKYPECKANFEPAWTDEEFEAFRAKYSLKK